MLLILVRVVFYWLFSILHFFFLLDLHDLQTEGRPGEENVDRKGRGGECEGESGDDRV